MYNKLVQNKYIRNIGSKIQSIIGTDLRYLTKNGLLLLVGQLVVSFAVLGLTWVLANYVDKETVGQYRFILSIQVVLSLIALSGLNTSLLKSVAEGYNSSLAVAFRKKIKFGFYSGLTAVLVGVFYAYSEHSTGLFWGFVAVAISMPLYEGSGTIYAYLQGKKDFFRQSLYSSIVRVVTTIVSAIACFYHANLFVLVAVNFFISGLIQLYMYRSIQKTIGDVSLSKKDDTFVHLGIHLTIMGILLSVVGQLDRFILFQFFGATVLAVYWIAATIPLEFGRIINIFSTLALPKFVQANSLLVKKTLPKKIYILSGIFAVCAAVYIGVAPYLYKIFFPEYMESVALSQILVLSIIWIPYQIIWQYFTALGVKKILYINHIVDPTVQILLYIILIPSFGLMGLVWAQVLKYFILYVYSLVLLYVYNQEDQVNDSFV